MRESCSCLKVECTEGVILSGLKTSSGRTSGETIVWRRRGKAYKSYNLSGKRTELIEVHFWYFVVCIFRGQTYLVGLTSFNKYFLVKIPN